MTTADANPSVPTTANPCAPVADSATTIAEVAQLFALALLRMRQQPPPAGASDGGMPDWAG